MSFAPEHSALSDESPDRVRRRRFWRRALVAVVFALLGAGLFYSAWLALFLLIYDRLGSSTRTVLWMSAPVATSLGYSAGILLAERLTRKRGRGLLSVFAWPLVGCAVGAAVVFPFGAMLIVFGMFGAGTASVLLRELAMAREGGD